MIFNCLPTVIRMQKPTCNSDLKKQKGKGAFLLTYINHFKCLHISSGMLVANMLLSS